MNFKVILSLLPVLRPSLQWSFPWRLLFWCPFFIFLNSVLWTKSHGLVLHYFPSHPKEKIIAFSVESWANIIWHEFCSLVIIADCFLILWHLFEILNSKTWLKILGISNRPGLDTLFGMGETACACFVFYVLMSTFLTVRWNIHYLQFDFMFCCTRDY